MDDAAVRSDDCYELIFLLQTSMTPCLSFSVDKGEEITESTDFILTNCFLLQMNLVGL